MRLKLISCQVFTREMEAAINRSPHAIEVEFLSMGLHEVGCIHMRENLQSAIDRADTENFDAILMGYGLCNNGLVGLHARFSPLIVPRAHDCITLLLGSKERYLEYFNNHPGVYFRSTGWLENYTNPENLSQLSFAQQNGMHMSKEQFIEKYGEDSGLYLWETLGAGQLSHYDKLTFIEMGVEPDNKLEKRAECEANNRGWRYEKIAGDLSLIQRMLDGEWNKVHFLVVPPGKVIESTHDERIIASS